MNWNALTKKQQQMVLITLILAVAQIVLLVRFLGGTSSSTSSGPSSKVKLERLQDKLDDARMILMRSTLIEQELAESIQQIEALQPCSPTSSDRYAWAYEYISLRAALAGVELASLEEPLVVGKKKDKDAQELYEIIVKSTCGYNELVEFLWRLEQGNKLLRVKEVSLRARPSAPMKQQAHIVLQWPESLVIDRGEP